MFVTFSNLLHVTLIVKNILHKIIKNVYYIRYLAFLPYMNRYTYQLHINEAKSCLFLPFNFSFCRSFKITHKEIAHKGLFIKNHPLIS